MFNIKNFKTSILFHIFPNENKKKEKEYVNKRELFLLLFF